MLQIFLLVVLATASVSAQESPNSEAQAAPEPYNYGYQTDSHAASEQRDPQGRVTGFYMLTDADGRERRVDYVADEGGFRAKVATNEVGTKSESPADVEVVASAPSQGQLVYQSQPQPQPQAQVQYVRQQAAPVVSSQQYQYVQQPRTVAGYGYGSGYGSGNGNSYAYESSYYPGISYGYGSGYGSGYGTGYGYYPGSAYRAYSVGQQPATGSSYYRSVQTSYPVSYSSGSAQTGYPVSYSTGNVGNYRYVSQTGPAISGVQTVGYPVGGVTYSRSSSSSVVPVGGVGASRQAGYQGSSNYQIIQKRAANPKSS